MERNGSLSTNLKYSSFWRRFVASLVDALILIFIGMGISMSLGRNPFGDSGSESFAGTLDYLLSFLVGTAYSIIFWVKYEGQTPGKKVMHIRVVKEDGKQLDWTTAVIREFSYWVSFIPLALGYFWVIFDTKKQGWHDKIAGTYVVDVDEEKPSKVAHAFGILSVIIVVVFVILALLMGLGIMVTCNEKGLSFTQCFSNPEKLFEEKNKQSD